ncbi:MAG: hypothetical protein HY696_05325 [Deltaproteobacteria bacterium]|nr:hypothetical protein [Deltaproteobacteria bacterium]
MIQCRPNLTEYFREMLQRAATHLRVGLAEASEFYIVNLLNECRKTEHLFAREEDRLDDTPLAVLLERAIHSENLAERIRQFKRLGDMSLFIAGYFPQRAQRRLVDLDYYIRMGGGAYLSLASCFTGGDTFKEIYGELGEKFAVCVDLLAEVRRQGSSADGASNKDLLALYERWLETGSAHLERLLQREGLPTESRFTVKQ